MIAQLLLSFLLVIQAVADYVPTRGTCPTQSLVRPADGISDDEETFRVARKAVADKALKTWLLKTNPAFGTANLPTVALTTSGGGYRSLLSGAGVIQALDDRDSAVSTSGLYQALTYQAGLSGGSWLMSSLAGNNYPTVSFLKEDLWKEAFRDSLLDPGTLLVAAAYGEILSSVAKKDKAGFDTTLTDPWGRLLSYQLLRGSWGGVSTTLSSIAGLSNFTSYAVPFPIITALGVKTFQGECVPGPNATTYEFSPFEFGSFDRDVSAFTPTKYLGTDMKSGKPVETCTTNYDNLGYIFGTSSSLFNQVCVPVPAQNSTTDLVKTLTALIDRIHEVTNSDLYATYRNPFYEYKSPTATVNIANNISAQENLSLPSRNISVILVNDNSADTSQNFPNGTEILTTYVQSFNAGLTRMPFIPSVETFISQNLTTRATFFGCGDPEKVTIVYLPNAAFTFASGTSTAKLTYSEEETDSMIANGVQIGTQGDDSAWGTCLGCAIMMKTDQILPGACTACFEKYCYHG
ncbi:hypothetical protein VTL71DRAFT_3334 [Oculimacula yallundae]|uniref:Lysophospholipase n=1 Tax=Oculimacula yallundae TaxID=86028 RepID=A0ABR4C6U8_9HELO